MRLPASSSCSRDSHRLGGRVVGAVGVETFGDTAADRAGEQEEGDREEADAARPAVGETGQ